MQDPQDDIVAEFDENTNSFNILGSALNMFGGFSRQEAIEHASFSGQNYIEMFFASQDKDARSHIVKELFFLDYVFQCLDNEICTEEFEEGVVDQKARDYLDAVYTTFSTNFERVKEQFFNAKQSGE